jgi:hypothetical protein
MKRLILAAAVLLAVVAAPRSALANAARPVTAEVGSCATCNDGFTTIEQGVYAATWGMTGNACNPGSSNCAVCEPTCSGSGSIRGTWAEVSEWFETNSCENNECISEASPSPSPLEEQTSDELLGTVQASKGRLQFNEQRGSIQIYNCQGVISANVKLADDVARELAASLASR